MYSTDPINSQIGSISLLSPDYPPVFDFARFLDSEALSKAIYHSLGCK